MEELTGRLTEHERLSRESSDPEIRHQSEAELKQLKAAIARGTLDLQRLQGEEATLSQDLSAEQGRWSDNHGSSSNGAHASQGQTRTAVIAGRPPVSEAVPKSSGALDGSTQLDEFC